LIVAAGTESPADFEAVTVASEVGSVIAVQRPETKRADDVESGTVDGAVTVTVHTNDLSAV
jgi:hypothetical protein